MADFVAAKYNFQFLYHRFSTLYFFRSVTSVLWALGRGHPSPLAYTVGHADAFAVNARSVDPEPKQFFMAVTGAKHI